MLDDHGAVPRDDRQRPDAVLGDRPVDPVLEGLFRHGRLQVTQTPLVEIASGRPVAVRLLTHGPAEDADAAPARVRALVAASDQLAFLDEAARARALAEARLAPLLPQAPLVLDAHLASFSQLARNADPTPVVLVVDSTDAVERPAEMLRLVAAARAQGWEVGLREVGGTPASLAAVSVIEPALVVLSRRVLDEPTSRLSVETIQATTAFCHSSGAVVAAEDVADAGSEAAAVAAGATLACGSRYHGRARRSRLRPAEEVLRMFSPPLPVAHHSPFELAARRHPARRATKPVLVALSKRLEATAGPSGTSSLVLAAFQTASQFTPDTQRRYRELARTSTLVMAAAQGLHHTDVPGVSVTSLDPSDPLVHEWNVLVLAPTMSVMLAASDLRTPVRHQRDREFDYILTYDRDLVAHAARSMLSRLTHRAAPLTEA
ncbi:EAL domain, c-di-GMP-specific phosphodiesterase class I (or its enzymatically inactive variant) [Friedmanniella luteola]|uniref:EAL domain, c-di-GMP-specific phosphodiesterase class I (Or its enzymatically inactive variant) n=1 Tax=Friedmanniella luteola TaxID=546871 RepID=A0A1H1TYK5_9ACTN|nr:DICT sensory domain-containing protein [Friedmanniella luteola]SDS65036.1 EAL domain, c-di-GMP-specific phosphodiesterase class I (or its enzymatically inactive variant) [Friedmanniella luteola]